MRAIIIMVISEILLSVVVHGQNSKRSITATHITQEINIDGVLNEPVWQNAQIGENFWQFFPSDSAVSINLTQFIILYDNQNIYIGIKAFIKSNNIVVSSLRRDFTDYENDNVTVIFDTFKDGNTAYLFGMNPFGVKREVFVSEGGTAVNSSWDQKWDFESSIHDDYYILEASIPFNSIKYKTGETTWRIQVYRFDLQTNEQSAWAHVPQNQVITNLAFMGDLLFEVPLKASRTPFVIIPYVNAMASKDFKLTSTVNNLSFGGDAKLAIGNSMNLDITINPDFSNVEVDDIYTNLSRFELLIPEKRQFFIDNNDLFGSYGDAIDNQIPFFSRRVGLSKDTLGNLMENQIIGGVRLSGKINDKWRFGFLNIQTASDKNNNIASNNNMMLAVQRKMFARSRLSFFAINRQTVGDYDFVDISDRYNRVLGVDYDIASADNKWFGKLFLHKSFQPDDSKGNYSWQSFITYQPRNMVVVLDFTYVDDGFRADLGFVPRKGVLRNGKLFEYNFYPKNSFISRHRPGILFVHNWERNLDWKNSDYWANFTYSFYFTNQTSFFIHYNHNYTFLPFDFNPILTPGSAPIPGNKAYTYNSFWLNYISNPKKLFTYNIEMSGGEFFNGENFYSVIKLNYRIQPWASFGFVGRYDVIRLPKPQSSANFWLLTPKIDLTFSKNLYWSTLVQYSNQRDNLGINSRLQWRFAPLSDLHLVYNDNYFTKDFGPKFRSITLKISYWLNL